MSSHLLGPHAVDRPFFGAVNEWAQDTPWLHGAVLGFASYGVVLFGALLVTGWLLGGTVGVGTVLYALSIGPLAHVFIPLFARGRPTPEGALEAV